MKGTKKIVSLILTAALVFSLFSGVSVNAATKPKLNKKQAVVYVGKTIQLKVKKNRKKVKWFSSNKKVATVSKKGKVKGKRPGKVVITAKIGKKKYKCKVTVKKKTAVKPTQKPTVAPTQKPTVAPTVAPTQRPTVAPTQKPTVAPTQKPTAAPTQKPTAAPTQKPTVAPTQKPTVAPTQKPTVAPTQKPTTAKADDGKPGPKEVFGHTIISQKGLEVSFTWGSDADIMTSGQRFNVYYDGVLGENSITAGLISHTFEQPGTHVITIKGYLNGKESAGVQLNVTLEQRDPSHGTYWVAIQGEPADTYFYDDDTDVNIVSIQKPGFAEETGIYMNVKAGIESVSVNGTTAKCAIEGAGVVVYLSSLTEGKNTIEIKNGGETSTVIINKGKPSGTETTKTPEPVVTTPAPTQKPTQAPTTKPVETTTKKPQQPTTAINFTTDSSIEKPFGMNVEQGATGYVSVVWGRGSVDCYNVYVDGERRRTGVGCGKYMLPVYYEGTHTVAVTTVVGNKESEKTEKTITISGIGEKETEPETCPEELKPQLKDNVQLKNDRIAIELNNKTNGKYSDDQIYWCIIGNDSNDRLCYLDKDGNMIPASESLNTVNVNGTNYANIYHTLAEADYVYAPTIGSGRMYLSYGKPVYIKFEGTNGYAGPDLNNPSNVNANTLFEFAEFTIKGKNYWGNTTRVDYFCFPMITRLVGNAQYNGYDKVVGDVGTRDEIFNAFKNEAPNAFKSLVRDDRIIAPCKSTFNSGKENGNYFDSYINEFWTKFAKEDLKFSTESGSFTGRVVGNKMQFTRAGDSTIYYVDKPTTQEVLEGKGAFDRGNGVEKAIEAQLCAAFNRGVATEPDKYYKVSEYYKNSTNNFYAGFFHRHSVLGYAYGFCYDDVNDQSTLLQYGNADALVIDLKW